MEKLLVARPWNVDHRSGDSGQCGDGTAVTVLNTPRVAIRPTPDGALALDSAWSEEEVVVKADGTYEIKDSTVQGLLDEASKILEGNPKLEFASYGVGPKPIRATVNRYSAN
jgi:hypothetical protein